MGALFFVTIGTIEIAAVGEDESEALELQFFKAGPPEKAMENPPPSIARPLLRLRIPGLIDPAYLPIILVLPLGQPRAVAS